MVHDSHVQRAIEFDPRPVALDPTNDPAKSLKPLGHEDNLVALFEMDECGGEFAAGLGQVQNLGVEAQVPGFAFCRHNQAFAGLRARFRRSHGQHAPVRNA
jgi:hypothetical protein